MKSLLFGLFVSLMTTACQDIKANVIDNTESPIEHFLPYKVEWKTDEKIENIRIRSSLVLNKQKVEKIEKIYFNSRNIFFNDFEDTTCNPNSLGRLEIKIISAEMLRDRRYFRLATSRNFGRYFSISNTIYIIHGVFSHPEYLAHELAHYFYDECGIKFKNIDAEHVRVYKFQDLYKERNRHGRSR